METSLTCYLYFMNIPNLLSKVNILGYNEVCSSDHFGIHLEIKLNVS